MCMWLLDEYNAKEFVDDVVQPVFNDNGLCKAGTLNWRRWLLSDPSNTFKCTCKSNVKVYSINIDGKVFENIVSQEMVERLS